jgi:hypothetical protein
MKKKVIYSILATITTIILFTTAAICNMCTPAVISEESESVAEDITDSVSEEPEGTSSSETTTVETTSASTTSPETTVVANNPPEILDITYSVVKLLIASQYDILADATDPDGDALAYSWSVSDGTIVDPTVNPMAWTTPSSDGTYEISVTVDDGNGGSHTKTQFFIVHPLPNPVVSIEIPIVTSEGGYISQNQSPFIGDSHLVGDNITNQAVKSYISFDITLLSGKTVDDATLAFNISDIYNDPSGFVPLWIHAVNWQAGADQIEYNDFNLVGASIQSFSTPNFVCDSPKLKHYIQNAIDAGRGRFQIMLFFTGATDNNNAPDLWEYRDTAIVLNVAYF